MAENAAVQAQAVSTRNDPKPKKIIASVPVDGTSMNVRLPKKYFWAHLGYALLHIDDEGGATLDRLHEAIQIFEERCLTPHARQWLAGRLRDDDDPFDLEHILQMLSSAVQAFGPDVEREMREMAERLEQDDEDDGDRDQDKPVVKRRR